MNTITKKLSVDSPVTQLALVGSALGKSFKLVGINKISDLLYYFPTRYMDYRKTVPIAKAQDGETVTVIGRVKSVRSNFGFRSRVSYSEVAIEDGSGNIRAVWFNQTYIAKQFKIGDELILSGKVGRYKGLQLTNPAYDLIKSNEDFESPLTLNSLHAGRLVPIYRRTDLIPLRTIRRIIKSCLDLATELPDELPAKYFNDQKELILPLAEAIRYLHFPENEEQIAAARFRIAIDDVLPQQIAAQLHKKLKAGQNGFKIQADLEKVKAFLATLPYSLTASQKRAAWDIFQDLAKGKVMNRLLQGDVGSGKTIVAILASLQSAGNGFQTAMLAPTEILAKQHYDTFCSVLGTSSGIGLFTRTFSIANGKSVSKADFAKLLTSGEIQICIGTHALLQNPKIFKELAIVIIDEQHRFGVAQRSALLGGFNNATPPHLLSMSATPIPRTLAMSLYGDLEVSTLKQIPSGNKVVHTAVVPESGRSAAYEKTKTELRKGHQAFVVTPRVVDTDSSDVRSVKKEFVRLQKEVFPEFKLGLLYGSMKGAEKDNTMSEFASGKIDILVATSVIEIGIDIPNATVMIIEGSERFGLAQLHQLRGRIGRNKLNNYCFLFTTEDSQQDTSRLTALSRTNDGFALAELDLEERGFGDLFGKQQSGFLFRFPQFISIKALQTAKVIAENIVDSNPKLRGLEILQEQAAKYLEDMHSE